MLWVQDLNAGEDAKVMCQTEATMARIYEEVEAGREITPRNSNSKNSRTSATNTSRFNSEECTL
jgi:hypothetical protein